jgi:hypothetical protein
MLKEFGHAPLARHLVGAVTGSTLTFAYVSMAGAISGASAKGLQVGAAVGEVMQKGRFIFRVAQAVYR